MATYALALLNCGEAAICSFEENVEPVQRPSSSELGGLGGKQDATVLVVKAAVLPQLSPLRLQAL